MNTLLEVRSGPAYYACKANVLENLEVKLSRGNIRKVLVIHGQKSWEVTEPFFPSLENIETIFFTAGNAVTRKLNASRRQLLNMVQMP
ncbi:hypothetical protein ACQKM1_14250 [Peribacillus frigoritolerans]|uniref:hypothetical protein n=1 Tax=Peribacillus frigoritolerans TaxID=450367 RepID=UPI003CFFC4A0